MRTWRGVVVGVVAIAFVVGTLEVARAADAARVAPGPGSDPGQERAGGRDGCRHAAAEHDVEGREHRRPGGGPRHPDGERHRRQADPEADALQRPPARPGGRPGGSDPVRDDDDPAPEHEGGVRRAVLRVREVHPDQAGERGGAPEHCDDEQPRRHAGRPQGVHQPTVRRAADPRRPSWCRRTITTRRSPWSWTARCKPWSRIFPSATCRSSGIATRG